MKNVLWFLPKLDLVAAGEDCLHGPLGQLASIVFEFVGQNGAALSVQLLPPLNAARKARIPLVQSLPKERETERLSKTGPFSSSFLGVWGPHYQVSLLQGGGSRGPPRDADLLPRHCALLLFFLPFLAMIGANPPNWGGFWCNYSSLVPTADLGGWCGYR